MYMTLYRQGVTCSGGGGRVIAARSASVTEPVQWRGAHAAAAVSQPWKVEQHSRQLFAPDQPARSKPHSGVMSRESGKSVLPSR